MRRVLLFLFILTISSAWVFAGQKHWNTASNGNWNDATNWTPNGTPASTDTVYIDLAGTYTITYNLNYASVKAIYLGASGGIQTLSNPGNINGVTDTLFVLSNGVFQMTGGFYSGTRIINQGTVRLLNGSFSVSAPIVNMDSLYIAGTTITLSGTFTNNDSVFVASGTAAFSGGGTSTSGHFVLSGGTLQFSGGTQQLDANSGITGTGAVNFSSGTDTLRGLYNVTDSTTFSGANVTFLGSTPSFGTTLIATSGTVNINTADSVVATQIRVSNGTMNFNMNDSIIVNTLLQSGGTIGGNSPIRIASLFDWKGGTMSATDSLVTTLIASQAPLSVNNHVLQKRTLINEGTITWTAGYIYGYDGAVFINSTGRLIDIQTSGNYNFQHVSGTPSTFINHGTLRKSTGSSTATIQIQSTHANGAVDIQNGILQFAASGSFVNTDFALTNNSILQFNGGTQQLDANSDITGTGAMRVYSGADTIRGIYNVSDSSYFIGGTTTFAGSPGTLQSLGAKLRMDGGTTDFSTGDSIIVATYWQKNGTLTGNSPMKVTSECLWESGTITATDSLVTTLIPAGVSLTTNGLVYLAKRTFDVYANMIWSGGWFRCYNGAIINNYGIWDHQVNNNIEWVGGSLPNFNNYETYIKSTNATNNFIDIGFNTTNSIVQVKTGTLNINNMSNSIRSRFIIDSSATLQWDGFGRTHTIDSLSSITGAGNLAFYGGTTNMKDTLNIGGETFVFGGTANFAGPQGTLKSLGKKFTLGNASAYFYGDTLKIDTLLTSGTLGGTSPIYIKSKLALSGGSITSTDSATTVTVPVGAIFYWNGAGAISRRTLNNYGTAIWTFAWGLDQNAVYNNMPGALTDWTVDDNSNWFGGSSNNFNNYGTLRKSGGTGTSSFEYYVNNYGLIQAQTGTILFFTGGTHVGGLFVLSPGSTINFSGGNHTFDASSSVTGTGTVLISPSTFTMNGVYDINGITTISGGTVNFDSTFKTTVRTTFTGGTTNFKAKPGYFLGLGNKMNLAGGTVNFLTTDSLVVDTLLVNGTLNGNNSWYIRKLLQLTAGNMTSPDSTLSVTIPVGATFLWSGNGTIERRTIFNYGTATWSSPWGFSNSVVYNNMPGALTDLTTDYNSNWFFATSKPFFNNYGTLRKSGGTGISSFEYPIQNYGILQIDSALTILEYDSLLNYGTGIIQGKGTIDVSTRFRNLGHISPGTSPGTLKITGNFKPTGAANFDIELGGLTQGTQYDNLIVSGTATLNGNLNISKINGFQPSVGDSFKVMDYASKTGTFANIFGANVGGGVQLLPDYRTNQLVLYGVPANNSDPTAVNDNVVAIEDILLTIHPLVNDTDMDGDTITIASIVTPPLHGSYAIVGDTVITYTPSLDYNGTDSLVYVIQDGHLGNASASIYITVNAVNDAPVVTSALRDTSYTEDFPKTFVRLLSDVFTDVDNGMSFGASNLSAGVTPFISNDSLYVLSTPLFTGLVDIRVTAFDGEFTIADTFKVNVSAVNHAPIVAIPLRDTTFAEDFTITFLTDLKQHFADTDNDTLSFGIEIIAGNVIVQIPNDSLYVSGGADFNGLATIRVTASDAQFTVSDTFSVNVIPVNDAPVRINPINDMALSQDFGKQFAAMLTGFFSDIDNDPLTFDVATLSAGVDGVISNDSLYVLSTFGFTGASTLKVTASDGQYAATDTFLVNVTAVNAPPVLIASLRDTSYNEDFGKVFYGVLTDYFSDPNSDPLTFTDSSSSSGITPLIQNDSLYFISSSNFNGTATMYINASDGSQLVSDTFLVQVNPQNDPPSALTLLAPANNALTNILRPVFRWSTSKDVDGDTVHYTLEIASDQNFTSVQQSYLLTDTTQTPAADLDSTGTYYWRVTSADLKGGTFQSAAFTLHTDAAKPGLRISILQGTITQHYLDAYVYSDEVLTGAVNATFTLRNGSGTIIDNRSASMTKIGTSDFYSAQYHLVSEGTLQVQVTGQDIAGNQSVSTRQYAVSAFTKGKSFTAKYLNAEIKASGSITSESGFILISARDEKELTTIPSVDAGIELIGTTELKDPLDVTIHYNELTVNTLKSDPTFDEKKIGIYRIADSGYEYVGGQGRESYVTASVQSFGKYAVLYNPNHSIIPDKIELLQNYPNPFNPSTTIQYGLANSGKVKLVIYNILGQAVRELINDNQTAGYHKILWDGRNRAGQTVSTGVYIYRLETPNGVLARKMMLIK